MRLLRDSFMPHSQNCCKSMSSSLTDSKRDQAFSRKQKQWKAIRLKSYNLSTHCVIPKSFFSLVSPSLRPYVTPSHPSSVCQSNITAVLPEVPHCASSLIQGASSNGIVSPGNLVKIVALLERFRCMLWLQLLPLLGTNCFLRTKGFDQVAWKCQTQLGISSGRLHLLWVNNAEGATLHWLEMSLPRTGS